MKLKKSDKKEYGAPSMAPSGAFLATKGIKK
jgi:hypothetical protein